MWRSRPQAAEPPLRGRAGRVRLHALLACGALPGLLAAATAGAAEPETLLLALRLNGVAQDRVVRVLRVDGALALEQREWQALNLRAAAAPPRQVDGLDYSPLAGVAGVQARVDDGSQTLVLDVPAAAFGGSSRSLDGPATPAAPQALPGGWLNYDLLWQRSSGPARRHSSQALLELGTFAASGHTRITGIARTGTMLQPWTRLDSSWTYENPATMQVLQVGDAVAGGGSWGRSMRVGGLHWATDFSLRPGFLSYPLPALQGETALPSTMDLYINNSRVAQSELPAGAFELRHVPVVTGQGELRMVVRDLLGREQEVVQPYYAAPALLRPGLHARAATLGRVRLDYGLHSNRYGDWTSSFNDRVGIDEHTTAEWRWEHQGRQRAIGATAMRLVPQLGLFNASAVLTHSPAGRGALLAAGVERQSRDTSGGLQLRYGTSRHRLAGSLPERTPRTELVATVARNWGGTAVGLSAVLQRTWQGEQQRLLTVNTARELGRWGSLAVLAQRDAVQRRTLIGLSLSIAIDARTVGGASVQHGSGGMVSQRRVDLQQSTPDDSGLGWQLAAEQGQARRLTGQAVWLDERAQLSAGLSAGPRATEARLGASGGITRLGEHWHAGRRVDGSFAVVDVGGYGGVRVLLDHRPVARTDAQGRALVTGLRGREVQRIGIDPADLPFDAEVSALDTVVTAPSRGGVAVSVAVTRARAATFTVLDAAGRALPPGTQLQVAGQSRRFPVGFDGKAFVSGLAARSQVLGMFDGNGTAPACSLWLELPAQSDELPDLGPQTCR